MRTIHFACCLAVLTGALLVCTPTDPVTAASSEAQSFDVNAATDAYLAKVPADQRAKSDAYFEGGYWLQLWNFLIGAAISLLLLTGRRSAWMRDLAERLTRRKPIQSFLYWVQYLIVTTALFFPMTVYQGYFREHKYGLSNQTFGAWLGDWGKGLGVGLVLGCILIPLLYGVIRKLPRTWWLWGAVTSVAFLVLVQLIAPIYIAPLFNKYTRLADPRIREPILSLARANGISANEVWVFDASRQTTRISANVSGFGYTQRISLNDNLLNRCTLPEVETVMGHEMGHYVLNHVYEGLLFFTVIIVIGFAALRWAFDRIAQSRRATWDLRGIGDVAGLPLVSLLLSVYFFVLTPVMNTYIRTIEAEADIYGLNAAREPDAEAEVALKLGEYRKLDPGPVERIFFYDHPSGRDRIFMAMRWKAEHLEEPTVKLPGPVQQ